MRSFLFFCGGRLSCVQFWREGGLSDGLVLSSGAENGEGRAHPLEMDWIIWRPFSGALDFQVVCAGGGWRAGQVSLV